MEFKEVTNRNGRTTFFVNGRRVSESEFNSKAAGLEGYNSSCSWSERGRSYHTFCTTRKS